MRSLAEHMAFYGAYHQDARNRATHFVGVPVIIFAVLAAMSLARLSIGGVTLTLAELFVASVCLYYLALDAALGLVLAAATLLLLWAADAAARLGTGTTLAIAGTAFVAGWAIQLLGHRFEGNKPALLDNLFQVIVSPIFLVAEAAFALGLRRGLRTEVERRIGARDFPGAERTART